MEAGVAVILSPVAWRPAASSSVVVKGRVGTRDDTLFNVGGSVVRRGEISALKSQEYTMLYNPTRPSS